MSSERRAAKKIIEKYKEIAIQYSDSLDGTDYKATNKAYDKITKLFHEFSRDDLLVEEVLLPLLRNEDIRVRIWAATHSLGLNKHINEAESVLKEASQIKEPKMLSFNAEKTLEVWKKQGFLKF